jgi:hypothetical protein
LRVKWKRGWDQTREELQVKSERSGYSFSFAGGSIVPRRLCSLWAVVVGAFDDGVSRAAISPNAAAQFQSRAQCPTGTCPVLGCTTSFGSHCVLGR